MRQEANLVLWQMSEWSSPRRDAFPIFGNTGRRSSAASFYFLQEAHACPGIIWWNGLRIGQQCKELLRRTLALRGYL